MKKMSKTKTVNHHHHHHQLHRSAKTSSSSSSSSNAAKSSSSSMATVVKRKNRKNITLGLKLEIIRRLEQGQSNSSICQEYHLPSSTVSTIRSKKEQIKEFCKNSAVQNQYYQISYPRNNIIEEVELALYEWIKAKNFQVENVKYHEIKDKALEFFEDAKRKLPPQALQPPPTSQVGVMIDEKLDFKASHGWFDRFRKRFSLKSRTTTTTTTASSSSSSSSSSSTNAGATTSSHFIKTNLYVNEPMLDLNNNNNNNNITASLHLPLATMIATANSESTIGETVAAQIKCLPSIDEPITVIEETSDQIMTKNSFENDIMELFWGKVVSSIFTNEKVNNQNGMNHLDAKSLAIVFKLSEAIINILESRDSEKKRFMVFKQNLAHILHPYREIYNRELSKIRDSLRNIYADDLGY